MGETPHARTVGWKTDECPARDAPPAGLAVGFWPDIEVLRGKWVEDKRWLPRCQLFAQVLSGTLGLDLLASAPRD